MSLLNIPSTREDPNYRYKMPKLMSKIEGRGNGIKTNIMNMGEIAKALKRRPEYPTKFCGHELGAQSKFEASEGKAIVNGAHETRDLQDLIDKFIEKFVLCSNCKLPEIDLVIKKGLVCGKCNACGHQGELDNRHKLAGFIVKNPPECSTIKAGGEKVGKKSKEERRALKARAASKEEDDDEEEDTEKPDKKKKEKKEKKDKEGKKEKKDKKDKKSRKTTTDDANDEEDISNGDSLLGDSGEENGRSRSEEMADESTTKSNGVEGKKKKSKKEKKQTEELLEKENLTYDCVEMQDVRDRLKAFLEAGGKTSPDFFQEVRRLQVSQDFDSNLRLFVVLEALFGPDLTPDALQKKMPFVKAVVDSSMSCSDVCTVVEDYIHLKAPSALRVIPLIVHKLYDADVVEEDALLAHYRNKKRVDNAGEAYVNVRTRVEPFLQWLEQNDDDSEDDEDEE